MCMWRLTRECAGSHLGSTARQSLAGPRRKHCRGMASTVGSAFFAGALGRSICQGATTFARDGALGPSPGAGSGPSVSPTTPRAAAGGRPRKRRRVVSSEDEADSVQEAPSPAEGKPSLARASRPRAGEADLAKRRFPQRAFADGSAVPRVLELDADEVPSLDADDAPRSSCVEVPDSVGLRAPVGRVSESRSSSSRPPSGAAQEEVLSDVEVLSSQATEAEPPVSQGMTETASQGYFVEASQESLAESSQIRPPQQFNPADCQAQPSARCAREIPRPGASPAEPPSGSRPARRVAPQLPLAERPSLTFPVSGSRAAARPDGPSLQQPSARGVAALGASTNSALGRPQAAPRRLQARASSASAPSPSSPSSSCHEAKMRVLIDLVLTKSGAQAERAIELLRHRVGAGRKVHGLRYTLREVDEAVRRFRDTASVADDSRDATLVDDGGTGVAPAQEVSGPIACQGAYMPPSVVSRLLGDDECAICLDVLRNQAQTIALCGHIFHRGCLDRASSLKCPTCRRPVDFDRCRLQDLKALVAGARKGSDNSLPSFLSCNLAEFSHRELLANCNARRQRDLPAFELAELDRALEELMHESPGRILVEGGSVTLTM